MHDRCKWANGAGGGGPPHCFRTFFERPACARPRKQSLQAGCIKCRSRNPPHTLSLVASALAQLHAAANPYLLPIFTFEWARPKQRPERHSSGRGCVEWGRSELQAISRAVSARGALERVLEFGPARDGHHEFLRRAESVQLRICTRESRYRLHATTTTTECFGHKEHMRVRV